MIRTTTRVIQAGAEVLRQQQGGQAGQGEGQGARQGAGHAAGQGSGQRAGQAAGREQHPSKSPWLPGDPGASVMFFKVAMSVYFL